MSTINFRLTNWDSSLTTNPVKVTQLSPPVLNGSAVVVGLPQWFTPVNGVATANGMLAGLYQLEIEGYTFATPVFFNVPNDSNLYEVTALITQGVYTPVGGALPFVSQIVAGPGIGISPSNGAGAVTVSTGTNVYEFALSDESTALTTGTKLRWRSPYGITLVNARASVGTVSVSGSVVLNVLQNGTSVFGTRPSINAQTKTSVSATPLTFTNTSVYDDSELVFNVDSAGSNATGLKAKLFYLR